MDITCTLFIGIDGRLWFTPLNSVSTQGAESKLTSQFLLCIRWIAIVLYGRRPEEKYSESCYANIVSLFVQ